MAVHVYQLGGGEGGGLIGFCDRNSLWTGPINLPIVVKRSTDNRLHGAHPFLHPVWSPPHDLAEISIDNRSVNMRWESLLDTCSPHKSNLEMHEKYLRYGYPLEESSIETLRCFFVEHYKALELFQELFR